MKLWCWLQLDYIEISKRYDYVSKRLTVQGIFSGYIKGGWNLRKAWKIYEKSYQQVVELLKDRNITYTVRNLPFVYFVRNIL